MILALLITRSWQAVARSAEDLFWKTTHRGVLRNGSRLSMPSYTKSKAILAKNSKYIPGGVVSVNRVTSPEIAFVKETGRVHVGR